MGGKLMGKMGWVAALEEQRAMRLQSLKDEIKRNEKYLKEKMEKKDENR